jgi:hypothetical protein
MTREEMEAEAARLREALTAAEAEAKRLREALRFVLDNSPTSAWPAARAALSEAAPRTSCKCGDPSTLGAHGEIDCRDKFGRDLASPRQRAPRCNCCGHPPHQGRMCEHPEPAWEEGKCHCAGPAAPEGRKP